jgi:S-adenosylmethionine:tRNA ribosyltransferase-isomerase
MLVRVRTEDFTFELPQELIAQTPAEPRDSARLLVARFRSKTLEHRHVRDLPDLLASGDLLVVNDTRVMAARLFGRRPETGGEVEALLVRPFTDTTWEVLFKPGRQARPGRRFVFETREGELGATVSFHGARPVVLSRFTFWVSLAFRSGI